MINNNLHYNVKNSIVVSKSNNIKNDNTIDGTKSNRHNNNTNTIEGTIGDTPEKRT